MTTEAQMREQFEAHMNAVFGNDQSNDWYRTHPGYWNAWRAAHQSATEQMKPLVEAAKKALSQMVDTKDGGYTVYNADDFLKATNQLRHALIEHQEKHNA